MKRQRLVLNAGTTFAQVLGNALVLFFLYRFLIRTIGLERLGVWSLLLASTSLVTLANQGLAMSVVKFVAKHAARESSADASLLLQTAILSSTVGLALVSLLLYPAARWGLASVLPASRLAEALAILPLALTSLWLNVLGMIAQAGLAGHELIDLCNCVEFAGSVSYLLLAFWLVPRHGLLGLAWAQVTQAALGAIAAWLLLRKRLPELPPLPYLWSRARFVEMAGYGAQFQWIAACQSVREPVTKALLTKFAGLSATAFYDLAARLVVTLRELIVQSNQVLVPTIAGLYERDRSSLPRIYRDSYRLIFFLAVPCFALVVVASPLASTLWIGYYSPMFVRFVALLALGWLVNVLCNPAYVLALGTGSLRWLSVGCTVTAFLNSALGLAAGKWGGGIAIVASSVFSLIVGYLIVLIAYHRKSRESFRMLLPRESLLIAALGITGAVASAPLLYFMNRNATPSVSIIALATSALAASIFGCMWAHPIRKRLFLWVIASVSS